MVKPKHQKTRSDASGSLIVKIPWLEKRDCEEKEDWTHYEYWKVLLIIPN